MEDRLLVFVSSVVDEFLGERDAVEKAVAAIPLTKPWVFEHSPAYAAPVAEAYLRKVRDCDIFILIVGEGISNAVETEYRIALEGDKPRLVFLKDSPRTPEASEFVRSVDVKWAMFSTIDELAKQVQVAISEELITGYRRYRLKAAEVGNIAEFGERLSSAVVLHGDDLEVRTGDVSGQVAVGSNIVQSLTDVLLPVNALLSASLLLVLSLDLLALTCAFSGPGQGMCPYCNLLVSIPAALFGLFFSVLTKSRINLALSLLVGGLGVLAVIFHLFLPIIGVAGFWPFLQPICLPLLGG